jgi:hypothetical protein
MILNSCSLYAGVLRIGSLYESPLSGLKLEFCGIGHKLDVI